MRKNAIARIIIWSAVLLVLLGILAMALLANNLPVWNRRGDRDTAYSPSAAGDGTSSCEFDADDIRELEIDWVSGNIILMPDESADTIRVSEEGVSDSENTMVCKRSGDTLSIQFCKDSISFPSFGISINQNISKDLTILVPADWICQEIEIDAAATDLTVRDLTMNTVSFDGASGNCSFENCTVEELDIDTASGDIRFQGHLGALDFDAASASFYGELLNTPSRVDMDSASGDLELVLPSDTGFTVSIDGMSNHFSSDFPTEMRNGRYVCGDGRCQISLDGMSGDVILREAK